jgi:proteasome assembly chaperone (PAC2) family protein
MAARTKTPAHLSPIADLPRMDGATMLLALGGWMDGGEVSTGTVRRLIDQLGAEPVATLDAEPFILSNFPGSMDMAAMFRPHVCIENGLIKRFEPTSNTFYASPLHKLLLFVGKEPNLNWRAFGDAIFAVGRQAGVRRILFVGSFGGSVPHTREPRLYCTVSHRTLLDEFAALGFRPSNYEGPGSFTTALLTRAADEGFEMVSLVAEIPGYLQGVNPLSIEAVTRRLGVILGLRLNLETLRSDSTEWEIKVSEVVAKDKDMSRHIRQLEEQYDDELIEPASDA